MVAWTTNASSHRGKNGTRVALGCPAGGTAATVWGTGMYTDDSSVCTAAAHAGLITLARGGVLTVEIAAGQAAYTGSTQHGVTSASWGTWSGSFFFVGSARPLPARLVPKPGGRRTIAWNMTARHLRSQVGKRITYVCSARGQAHTVWGSGIYTDDSSICTAAVHAGFVTFTAGGRVTLEIQSGQAAYQGSRSHGVTTASWRNWTGSFIFVVPMTAPAPAPTP